MMGARENGLKRSRGMANVAASGAVTDEGLLLAAREIFAREGYSGTSVREIMAASGVTKPGSAKPMGEERG
jgi:AcrR family transcriptional regulator